METSENSKKNRTSREQEKGKTMKIPQVFMDVSLKDYLNGDSCWTQIKYTIESKRNHPLSK